MKTSLFLVWKAYQRRSEVLAPLLESEVVFLPHRFKSKFLRPLDYFLKLVKSIAIILFRRPSFVVVQGPPPFAALPALLTGVPYVIDAHNPLFQVKFWHDLPFSQYLIRNAKAIIVHNEEMCTFVGSRYPEIQLITIADPIEVIESQNCHINKDQILVIASFDPWDEPVELLVNVMRELKEFRFILTADVTKLPQNLREQLLSMDHVELTGFLPVSAYHRMLCSSTAALVLTTSEATQPSGACESLAGGVQLILSRTSLTESLFGSWAVLVQNQSDDIVHAIRSLKPQRLDLSAEREVWNEHVRRQTAALVSFMDSSSDELIGQTATALERADLVTHELVEQPE